jgi:hypothetical protein
VILFPLWIAPAVVAVISSFKRMIATSNHAQTRGAVCGYCILFVILFTLSGILGIQKQMHGIDYLWSSSELEIANWIRANVGSNSAFSGNCPSIAFVAVLTGRPVYCVEHSDHFGLLRSDECRPIVTELFEIPGQLSALPPSIEYFIAVSNGSIFETDSQGWSLRYASESASIYQRITDQGGFPSSA